MNKERTLKILWIIAITLSAIAVWVSFVDCGYTEVCFIDVGQGDSCFIKTEKCNSILIDGGDEGSGRYVLEPFLRNHRTLSLDAVFISHLHSDHMQGIIELLDAGCKIGKIYIPDITAEKNNYAYLKKIADKNSVPLIPLSKGDTVQIDEVLFTILSSGTSYEEENDNSLVMRLDCGENSILFTGDATKTVEKTLPAESLDTDFLKVAHHGSYTSSDKNFLKAVTPEMSIISVGEKNQYNHPSERTLLQYKVFDLPIARTDYDGSVTIIMTQNDILNILYSRERSNDI